MKNIFAVYKPSGISSFGMVARVRRILGIKKVGHAGTLDPLARGVLVIGAGREGTKLLASEVAKEKEYLAEVTLGFISSTDDAEGEKAVVDNKTIPDIGVVEKVVSNFIGEIMQIPPAFSAIKVAGQRAYKLARSGQQIELKARPVWVKDIKIVDYCYPILRLKVTTGPGVYIRSLARDIGKDLGVGGYLSDLERTMVGDFGVADCIDLDNLRAVG